MIPALDSYSFHRFFGETYPGLDTDPGTRITVADFIATAHKLGAGGVSLESCFFPDFEMPVLEGVRRKLDDLQMARVWAWGHPRGLESGRNAEALADLVRHIGIAKTLSARVMRICAGGRGTPPEKWSDHKSALMPLLLRATEEAARQDIVLAVENHIDLLADQMLEIVETIGSPHFKICLDTANNLRLFEDPLEVARKLVPHAAATHVKDITAFRGDPKKMEFWPSVPAGQGLIPLPAIVTFLRDAGYDGLLALEIDYLHPRYKDEETALKDGLAYLKTLL